MSAEQDRLQEARDKKIAWKKWGPYLSERQWGTVREDYSANGDAWNYFTHDQARSRAYRWGEDGIGGISDHHQILCFALALWNGKYPHAAYPYGDLVDCNRRRNKEEMEYELLDTGVFNDNRYCDVFVEYAKDSPDEVCIQITVCNRGKEATSLHLLPTLWFRNTWSWQGGGSKPVLQSVKGSKHRVIHAHHTDPLFQESLADTYLYCEGTASVLF
ncbi:MAG: MGH1-like glycoside hydrolase domain-containing protein, partial [Nitrospiraceae bacterium]